MKTALVALAFLSLPAFAQKTACGTARWIGYNNDVYSRKMTAEMNQDSGEDTKQVERFLTAAGYRIVPCADAKVKLVIEYALHQYSSSKPVWLRYTITMDRGPDRYQKHFDITELSDRFKQQVFKEVKAALDWSLQNGSARPR